MPERGDGKTDAEFLKRWSRKKTEAEQAAEPADAAQPAEVKSNQPGIDPADLPDIEGLDADSDYSVFMKEGVPEELKRLALRKLWMSNPIFSSLDGLNDYDEDYSLIGMVAEKVKTAYQVGRGYAEEVEELVDGTEVEDGVDIEAGENSADSDGAAEDPTNAPARRSAQVVDNATDDKAAELRATDPAKTSPRTGKHRKTGEA